VKDFSPEDQSLDRRLLFEICGVIADEAELFESSHESDNSKDCNDADTDDSGADTGS
jgi:hypothetical protein